MTMVISSCCVVGFNLSLFSLLFFLCPVFCLSVWLLLVSLQLCWTMPLFLPLSLLQKANQMNWVCTMPFLCPTYHCYSGSYFKCARATSEQTSWTSAAHTAPQSLLQSYTGPILIMTSTYLLHICILCTKIIALANWEQCTRLHRKLLLTYLQQQQTLHFDHILPLLLLLERLAAPFPL